MRLGAAGRNRVPGLLSRRCRWRKREVLDVVLGLCAPAPAALPARGSSGSPTMPVTLFAGRRAIQGHGRPGCEGGSRARSA